MALTSSQLRKLRAAPVGPSGNRVGVAMDLLEMNQAQLAVAVACSQPYVSDVFRGRYPTLTVENAHKFADFFGCAIEDLFPARAAVAS